MSLGAQRGVAGQIYIYTVCVVFVAVCRAAVQEHLVGTHSVVSLGNGLCPLRKLCSCVCVCVLRDRDSDEEMKIGSERLTITCNVAVSY